MISYIDANAIDNIRYTTRVLDYKLRIKSVTEDVQLYWSFRMVGEMKHRRVWESIPLSQHAHVHVHGSSTSSRNSATRELLASLSPTCYQMMVCSGLDGCIGRIASGLRIRKSYRWRIDSLVFV